MPAEVVTCTSTALRIPRKPFVEAMNRLKAVIPNQSIKPILQCVRMETSDGILQLTATDLELSVSVTLECVGDLPTCLVPCHELLQRIKTGTSQDCLIEPGADGRTLRINGGRVEHTVHTMDPGEYPVVPTEADGRTITLSANRFKEALSVANTATCRSASRYAINGILLESDEQGARLVATDGHRLVARDVERIEADFEGQVILPRRMASLAGKLIGTKDTGNLTVFVRPVCTPDDHREPAHIHVAGPGWLISCREIEGSFPKHRDVVPTSHSKFIVDRKLVLETLKGVSAATSTDDNVVRVELRPDAVCLSGHSAEVGQSSGTVPAEFAGGGDDHIITGFHPAYLVDALENLSDDRIVIDVQQNTPLPNGRAVRAYPVMLYEADQARTRWVVMPVNLGLEPSIETLGSNYKAPEQSELSEHSESPTNDQSCEPVQEPVETATPTDTPEAEPPTNDPSPASDSPAQDTPAVPESSRRQRHKVEHVWPEVGTLLEATFQGQVFTAVVVNAPKLKSGRAIFVTSGQAKGEFRSMTSAMEAVTATQRQKLGNPKSKKGLPGSGWDFWKTVQPRRATA